MTTPQNSEGQTSAKSLPKMFRLRYGLADRLSRHLIEPKYKARPVDLLGLYKQARAEVQLELERKLPPSYEWEIDDYTFSPSIVINLHRIPSWVVYSFPLAQYQALERRGETVKKEIDDYIAKRFPRWFLIWESKEKET